ncbi:MAG: phosphotransferase family protein [Candidatus Binataceae bacterium]
MSDGDFAGRLAAAVARQIGKPATLHDLQRLTGGATKTTWAFDADVNGARGKFIVQLASFATTGVPDPLAGIGAHLSADEDAHLMIAAAKVGVPAPRVYAILDDSDGLGAGYITGRVDGETLGPRIVRDDRFAAPRAIMADRCGRILAAIHSVDLAQVPFLKRYGAVEQIATQRKVVDHYRFRLPAIEFGLRWAAEHAPTPSRHTAVHGDFRNGNLIVGDDGIRCVLDWEIGHSGDPMEDVGWVCVKTWRFGGKPPVGGFGTREQLFAGYEKASGHSVDPASVRFWEAFGGVRWAIGCLRKGLRYTDGTEPISIEQSAIGRRIEEPLWDYLNLIEGKD